MAHDEVEHPPFGPLPPAFGNPSDASVSSMCIGCAVLVGVMGAGVVLMPGGRLIGPAGVSDPTTEALEELQYTLGEGPAIEAARRRAPVLVPDLAESGRELWPSFAAAALRVGVQAVFGLPLLLESICIGGLDLYHDQPGALSDAQFADALAAAQLAARTVLAWQAAADEGTLAWQLEEFPAHRAEVHQATGMISVQVGVSVDDAQALLRAYAFAESRPISDVARDVVQRDLRLT